MNFTEASLFWGFLLVYGVVMYVLSPKSKNANSFYRGADDNGNPVGQWSLTASIFISWIFAKSVTNAANLGAEFGLVGGLAYATYWLSIPLCGYVIYRLRRRFRPQAPGSTNRYALSFETDTPSWSCLCVGILSNRAVALG